MPEGANLSREEEKVVTSVVKCVETFTDHFNARNPAGMDSMLHFPHVILSRNSLVIWDHPGQLNESYFRDLSGTGWHCSIYHSKYPILIRPKKVHLGIEYSRNRKDGSEISRHKNVWVVTFEKDRWGIKIRS